MTASAFPLQWPDGWPRTPYHKRQSSPFKVNAEVARRHLFNELKLLGARNIVMSSNVALRGDGLPYAGAMDKRYDDPGVAIYFTLDGEQRTMARDVYPRPQDNMRSLGLAVEAMRALERHGGSHMMKRAFTGFAALPPPRSCWDILGLQPGASADAVEGAFRKLAMKHHPDQGGSTSAMADLNRARLEALRT